jgi:hypothetical protein
VRTASIIRDDHSTWQYNPEDSSEHHTRCRENLKSHKVICFKLFGENCMKIITTEQIFLSNYDLQRFLK